MSATRYLDAELPPGRALPTTPASRFLFLASLLTLAAIAADQFAVPILRTTAPLWATLAFGLLVGRRGENAAAVGTVRCSFSVWRVSAFILTHLVLVLFCGSFAGAAEPYSGSANLGGTFVALGKLTVLAPTLLLLPLRPWRRLASAYSPEAIAALLVLTLNVPRRTLEFVWPWYGRMLAWVVYFLSRSFVPGLTYDMGPEPTLIGPHQDTALNLLCSGIDAFELLSYVFGVIVLLDWNRLRKGRIGLIYLGCLLSMLICNAFRIAILVILGNHGFADFVESFHATAGSAFFCCVFLVYISLTYRWMTNRHVLQA